MFDAELCTVGDFSYVQQFKKIPLTAFVLCSPPTPSRKYYPIPMPLSKPGKCLAFVPYTQTVFTAPVFIMVFI